MYENRRMKPVEIVLQRGEEGEEEKGGKRREKEEKQKRMGGGKRKNDGGGKPNIHCEHIHKYHNIPLYNYYMLIKS
jgi:hypothetical protein